jgi:hypothetical protein
VATETTVLAAASYADTHLKAIEPFGGKPMDVTNDRWPLSVATFSKVGNVATAEETRLG